jgi:hypothetical protein
MEEVTIKKDEVLSVLKANRTNHRKIFEEALEGYKKKMIETLENSLADARAGKLTTLHISLPKPQDQTRDYDRAIKMLEMSIADSVTLSEQDFACYIQDDWMWKRQFLTSNAFYSGSATMALKAMDE